MDDDQMEKIPGNHPLKKQWSDAWMAYLTNPQSTDEERRAVLELDRKCAEAGLFPRRLKPRHQQGGSE